MRSALHIAIILLLAVVIYCWAYAPYGYCDTDQGFISGLAWRIMQGQTPYLDFIYVRPPLSLYLHAGILQLLPASWEGIGVRAVFYLMMAASAYWATRSLQSYFDFQNLGLSPAIFALLAFVFSVHNFPPMPWHTVDGVFWASLGIFAISARQHWGWHSLGLIALIAAAACKQAFYPMPFLGLGMLWILDERKISWPALIPPLVVTGGLISLLLVQLPDFLPAMLQQTSQSGGIRDLLEAGFMPYTKPLLLIVLPLIIVWQATSLYHWRWLPAGAFWLVFLGLLSLHVIWSWQHQAFKGPSYGFSQAFWLLGLGVAIKGFWLNNRAYAVLLTMLGLAWCSGISWGATNPMLFFAPVWFAFLLGLREEFNFQVPRYVYGLLTAFIIWCFAMLYQFPYRDAPRAETNYHLGVIFPSQQRVFTGRSMFEQSQELRQMHDKYGKRFTVLPAFPAAHYLLDITPVFGVDWAHNAEVRYDSQTDSLQHELERSVDYVLLQKNKREKWYSSERYGCLLASYVAEHWTLIDETRHFEVYQPHHP